MRLALIFLLFSFTAQGQFPLPFRTKALTATPKYCRSITVDRTKVPTANQTDFPVLFSGTYSYLATVANGGKVQDAQGDDIIFYTGGCGVETLLNWEIEKWNSTTGEIQAWIKVPTLTTATDYVFYVGYGDVSRTTFAGNITGTWNSAFKGTWHMSDASSPALDATSNDYDATATASPTFGVAGKIGNSITFNGSTQYLSMGSVSSHSFVQNTQVYTISFWVKFASNTARQILMGTAASSSDKGFFIAYENGAGAGTKAIRMVEFNGSGTSVIDGRTPDNVITDANWHHVFMRAATGDNLIFYIDGTFQATTYGSTYGTLSTGNSTRSPLIATVNHSTVPLIPFNGTLDELRIADVTRSSDWMTTEYNNQSSPSTFYAVGSETTI